jgi:hypothetical protein
MSDGFQNNTVAWGLKAGGDFGMFDASIAYSSVNDGDSGVFNVGGVKTPLYTQMILNQNAIRIDSDTFVVRAGMKALGGKFDIAYNYSILGSANTNGGSNYFGDNYQELDLTYKTKVLNDTTTLFAGYIYRDAANWQNGYSTIRFWARYNF